MSIGLGSFSNLGGGNGLRLGGLPVISTAADDLNADNISLVAFFVSPSGEEVSYMQAGRGQAAKLESELNFKKYGNLDDFSIELLRDNKISLFNGMNVKFFYKNKAFAFGFIDEVPESDQSGGSIIITGSGYAKKLKEKKISLSVTNKTVNEVIEILGTTYFLDLGFNYDDSKNQAPGTNIVSAEWKDKDINKIIEDLVSISNENYDTVEFIYGVDEVGSFYFRGIQNASPITGYFEGFKYQNPQTETDANNIVNQVQVYRTTEADPKITEFVATYSDSDSIDNNGVFERKLIVSDFVDTATIEKLANGIIQNHKNEKARVSVENLLIDNFLNFGFYSLNNKLQEQKNIVSNFNDLTEWTQSLTTSTIALRDTTVFSGRLCYQWDIDNSIGDSISKSIEYFNPSLLRVYLRQDTAGKFLKITVNGIQGNKSSSLVTNVPANLVTNIPENLVVSQESDNTTLGIQEIGVPSANEWTAVNIDLTGFFKVESITIEVIGADDVEILVDRMEMYTESYVKRVLSLEEISYRFGSTDVIAQSATFGESKITLTEKLNKIDKKNTIAYDIFSKQ